MRRFLAAPLFLTSLTSSAAFAVPQGMTFAVKDGRPIVHVKDAPEALSRPAEAVIQGTWAASLKIGEEIHNFPVAVGEFPADNNYVFSFLFQQPQADGTPFVASGLAAIDGSNVFFLPRWGDATYICLMRKAEDKYEADCQGGDAGAHFTLKRISYEHPFSFRAAIAHTTVPARKTPDTGLLMFNSYQTAIEPNYVGTIAGTDLLFFSFFLDFTSANSHLGIGSTLDLTRAQSDPDYAYIPYFLSTLDGLNATAYLSSATKVDTLSRAPLVVQVLNQTEGLAMVISEPEN